MTRDFTAEELDLFLQDHLDVPLENYAPAVNTFPVRCQLVIRRVEGDGQLAQFLNAIRLHHLNVDFRAFVIDLLGSLDAPAAAGAAATRPFVVGQRPVLNRDTFWRQLENLARGAAGNRVLVVSGGVGKSYSRWPISHMCHAGDNGHLMVRVEVNAGNVANIDSARLATLIANRVWGSAAGFEVDDFAQDTRQAKVLGPSLIQRLSTLPEPRWLVIDELNLVNLDPSAMDLLCQLCEAVDAGECPQVWLFLLGLDQSKVGPAVGPYLPVDFVQRPLRKDIQDYLSWFAKAIGKPLGEPALGPIVDELNALLLAAPDHKNWIAFHDLLEKKCRAIKEGISP